MAQIRIHGRRDPESTRQRSALERGPLEGKLTVKHSARVGFAREGHEPTILADVAPDDLVELEVGEGIRLWSSVESLRSDCGLKSERSVTGEDLIDLGPQLPIGGQSRGVGDWVIQGLKILGVDVAGAITDFVASQVEGQLHPGPGLYRCAPKDADGLTTPRKAKGDRPTLVFLHGTGSSTQGGFGGLWEAGGARMAQLATQYGDDILAFQHRTLSQSPIENARELVAALGKVLPKASELHLVSHSRGGLVGELVARGNRVGGGSFDQTDLELFKGTDRARDLEALKDLRASLAQSKFTVTRFVRVACPTRGTTLASGRLDRYLSVILNILSHTPGLAQSALFDTFASLLAAVVKKRTDPRELPGLEAMMPGSPLVRMLNRPDVRTTADLRILGGDVAGTGFFGRLKEFATDLFFGEDHDLVVNTPAMFGGTDRASTPKCWIDIGGRVNHFNYFTTPDTASKLVTALTDVGASGFRDVDVPLGAVTAEDYRKRAPGAQPVVFVLPGAMGSTLTVDGSRVWLDMLDLANGGLAHLRAGAPKVRPEALIDRSYRGLVRHLSASHDVVPFPYDWRLSLDENATALRQALDERLDASAAADQPIRLLAHSMGGLVVRAMLATSAGHKTWKRMCAHPGARFIMLGTPNGGSHATGALLMARDAVIDNLALLDVRHTRAELLAIVAEFDGTLELLPHKGTLDLYDRATWTTLHAEDVDGHRGIVGSKPKDLSKSAGVDWTVPSASRLAKARAARDRLRASPLDPDRMIYVAGTAEQTPCDITIDRQAPPGRRVTVLATRRGDGRVPWDTIPSELSNQTFYMNAVHGDMAASEVDFPAIVDLLSNGTTTKLSRSAPVVRGITDEPFPLRTAGVEVYPDVASLTAAAMGGTLGRVARPATERTNVRVVHDNLLWAQAPVLVGHYRDDVFVGAEDFIDRQLDGRLRELRRLDLYPGPQNTAVIVLNDGASSAVRRFPGAIVAGLGTVGELTPGGLISTLSHALTMYGSERIADERRRRQEGTSTSQESHLRLSVTALLVGAGTGGVRLADSIQAILRAVQAANLRLAAAPDASANSAQAAGQLTGARITALDLCELFEDLAIQAAVELSGLSTIADFRSDFVFESLVVAGSGGRRRASFDELPGWWQRVRVTQPAEGTLRFESVTSRAGGAIDDLSIQPELIRNLLARATLTTSSNATLSGTLFELLVPTSLKQRAPDRRALVMMLDTSTAMLPWELLFDRWSQGSRPLSVESGLVRQFLDEDVAPNTTRAPNATALVIGDPPLDGHPDFPQLDGAGAEAKAVAALLREHGFDTKAMVGADATWTDVLPELYGQPYRVLHIAAHGVYEYEAETNKPKVTGVVLGKGVFLRPAEFRQLRVLPDLVFINCCHLGQGGEFGRSSGVGFPALAANVAYELIRMGVRAVVAAGWAVGDQAAKEFARVFYANMLAGGEFGRAVLAARQEIYARFGGMNTWGAYQCYGDPGFTLTKWRGHSAGDAFVSERQMQIEIEKLIGRIRGSAKTDDIVPRLEQIIRGAPAHWSKSGDTAALIAEAYAELGRFEEALSFADRVLAAEPASASLRAVEQLANHLARMADDRDKPDITRIRQSLRLLHHLKGLGETAERWSLIGAANKRLACRLSRKPRVEALQQMTAAYAQALERASNAKAADTWYPRLNLVAGRVALSWLTRTKPDVGSDMKILREDAKRLSAMPRNFWEHLLPLDVQLLDAALRGTVTVKQREALEGDYRRAITRAGTPRDAKSATDQIRFLATMAKAGKSRVALADALEVLRKALMA